MAIDPVWPVKTGSIVLVDFYPTLLPYHGVCRDTAFNDINLLAGRKSQMFLDNFESLSMSQFVENPVIKQTNIDEKILLWEFTLKATRPELKSR